MIVTVGVAAWTPKRALAGNLDRQRRLVACQDPAPCRDDPIHVVNYNSRTSVILKPMIERRKSKIHGWGVYATSTIPKNKRIIFYAGEKISNRESLTREL